MKTVFLAAMIARRVAAAALAACTAALSLVPAEAQVPDVAGVIQTAELNPAKPYFIPAHPRVTTTIRFPKEISAPEGREFIDESVTPKPGERLSGEYVVSWQQGDPYFTITPTEDAKMANLNVPYQGQTYVFYFYPVADQLKAIACLNLVPARRTPVRDNADSAKQLEPAAETLHPAEVSRQANAPEAGYVAPTPARLIGLLDRMKLLHATKPGAGLAGLVQAMNIQVAISREELAAGDKDVQGQPIMDGVAGEIPSGMNDAGLYQIILLRAVRDRRMNCVGFICLVRNTSSQVLAFDVKSFGARAGAQYLSQRISDASPVLKPGEQSPAYFIVQASRNEPLSAVNDWRISVDLVSPRVNPGAAIARGFGSSEVKP